ncbi:MAG: S9 family peptidase, partial [Actinomycetospora chiangmaiensis]|nr:S9 family peptidase [Actinomycetospora chiangmaiensis]
MTEIGRGFPVQPMDAPVAEVRPRRFSVHGQEITDPYAWLKAETWQTVLKDPAALPADIAAYLKAENAFSEAALAGTADLRRQLVAEMRGRMQEDESGVPAPDGPFAYYNRHRAGGQHPLICRRPATAPDVPESGPDPDETILIDGDREGEGVPFFEIAAAVHSDDHVRLAWSVDVKGSELYTIRVRDIA